MSSSTKKVGNKRHKCCICKSFYSATNQKDAFMARFPESLSRCRQWLKVVGNPDLLKFSIKQLRSKYICENHFNWNDYNKKRTRLRRTVVPSQHLIRPPLDDELVRNWVPITFVPTEKKNTLFCPTLQSAERITKVLNPTKHDHHYEREIICSEEENRRFFLGDLEDQDVVMHSFPNPKKHPENFKVWVKLVGRALEGLSENEIYKKRRICDIHFDDAKRNRCKRLNALSVPCLHLPNADPKVSLLDEDINFEDSRLSDGNADVEAGCTEIEYLEEDEAAVSDDDSIDKQRMEGTHSPSSFSFEQDLKLALDDIDLLFLSYAKTFRSLAKQFQSMLKLDIAKLFSRYELKNATLDSGQENNAVSENTETLAQSETPVENVNKPETEPKPSEAAFVSLKETVFRRVPLKEVPPEVIQVTPPSIPPVEESKADYKIFRVPPVLPGSQVIRTSIPSDPSLKYCKIIRPITRPRILKPTTDIKDNDLIKTSSDPVVKLDRLDIVTEAQGELTSKSPPRVLRAFRTYVPRKNPAHQKVGTVTREASTVNREVGTVSGEPNEEEEIQKDLRDPDLDMEVHTETVFLAREEGAFGEEET